MLARSRPREGGVDVVHWIQREKDWDHGFVAQHGQFGGSDMILFGSIDVAHVGHGYFEKVFIWQN